MSFNQTTTTMFAADLMYESALRHTVCREVSCIAGLVRIGRIEQVYYSDKPHGNRSSSKKKGGIRL
jgi:hypothetical protein